jgi:hypothetical protein
MGIISALLVAAVIPTANNNWIDRGHQYADGDDDGYCDVDNRPCPAEHAACYFGITKTADRMNVISVVISAVFIVVGYIVRVVRLHKTLSVKIVGRIRNIVSKFLRRMLTLVHQFLKGAESPHSIGFLLLFRPLLALFILGRVLADLWTSMFFEVG